MDADLQAEEEMERLGFGISTPVFQNTRAKVTAIMFCAQLGAQMADVLHPQIKKERFGYGTLLRGLPLANH